MLHDKTSARRSTSAAPKVTQERASYQQPGQFAGWISEKWRVAWIVTDARKDRRTGVIRPVKEDKVYLLQYEVRAPGQHKARAQFQGIAAQDHVEAAQKAREFLASIGLGNGRREFAELYFNERKIPLWIEPNENAGQGK